ncbi:hypothetical protein JCM11641_006905 [Rhodosporidiobolus odoratus]
MGLGACCVSGYKHEGTPSGKFETLEGYKTYVALPEGEYNKEKALLFLTDIFGTELPNGQLLVDSFACSAANIPVYMPDLPLGDPISKDDLNNGKVDLGEWFGRHSKEITRPVIDGVVKALRAQGVKEFAAIGYCWGARYVVDLVFDDIAKVGIVAHPSLLEIPKDVEELNKKPAHFLWLNALQDYMHTQEKQQQTREILKENPRHKHLDFEGGHGFALRGNLEDPKQAAEADRAFKESVAFIKEHL